MKKISACLGVFLITLFGCESSGDRPVNDNIDIFRSLDKMLGVNDKNYINLEGNWRFSIGDDIAWALPEYDDNNWDKIKVPSTWEDQGFHGYNGYAWYRKTFEVPKELAGSNFILNGGFIDDVDETYINGKLVGITGGFPPQYVTAYDAHREYYISKDILKEGKNLIAIRVYDSQLEGGIIRGAVGLSLVSPDVRMITSIDLDMDLSGSWKFHTGDNTDWKNSGIDDSHWKEIFAPAYWEVQGYKDYDGFAWYRKSFVLPEKYSGKKLVLMMGMIDDIDQTYINGTLVGSVGDWYFEDVPNNFNQNSEWETLRGYYIPADILQTGKENTIAVRVYDGFINGGIYRGPIGLITQENYQKYWNNIKDGKQ
jgi:sialate O-acetylesterase